MKRNNCLKILSLILIPVVIFIQIYLLRKNDIYKDYIVIMQFLFGLVIYLLLNIRKRKKTELDLKITNEELFKVYEELASSEEELKLQYNNLEESKEIIRKNEERYRLITEASNDGFWYIDNTTNGIFINKRLEEVLGLDELEARNYTHNIDKYVHPDDLSRVSGIIDEIKQGFRESYYVEYRTLDKHGKYIWILVKGKIVRGQNGEVEKISSSYIDITQRKLQEEKIETLAYYDNTTGLPNRTKFYKEMGETLEQSKEKQSCGAIVYIDIDNFKIINDTFGHEFGDSMLREVSRRIKTFEQKKDNTFRVSGDEFILVVEDYNEKNIEKLIMQMKNRVSNPIKVKETDIQFSISIGVALYPDHAEDVEDILKKVELAMYKAKELGKNGYKMYEQNMQDEITSRLLLENKLRKALNRNEFVLNYQPQIDTVTKKVVGFEALIRWYSPEYGLVSPMKFIPVAEETGIINEIGEWVLREACRFTMDVKDKYDEKVVVSVNISSIQLNQDNFIEIVKKVIDETGVEPELLGIEITETSLMKLFKENSLKLEELKSMGVTVYLDDFGTGYSSLNYLLRLPIHTIKIDRGFIVDMMTDEKGVKITESIVKLAHSMGLSVTAEGVENEEQLSILKDLSCDSIQGYIFGKPLSEKDAFIYLEEKTKEGKN